MLAPPIDCPSRAGARQVSQSLHDVRGIFRILHNGFEAGPDSHTVRARRHPHSDALAQKPTQPEGLL